jgi:Domain of unknown function (DUF4424)
VIARPAGVLAVAALARLPFVEGRARANDSTALLAGGEITFKKSEAMAMVKTGANWKGPIGRFTLRIQKERATDKISVCLDGFRKVDDKTFVLEKSNFVPTRDLLIGFLSNTN